MKPRKRKWRISALDIVDCIIGLAVLMILTALVVPIFVPPDGKAASKNAHPAPTSEQYDIGR